MTQPQSNSSATSDQHQPATSVPVSRAQQLIWLGQSVAVDAPLYNLVATYTIDGVLDVERFCRACDQLVVESDILQSIVVDAEQDLPSLQRDRSIKANCQQYDFNSEEEAFSWVAARCRVPLDPQQKMFDCAVLSVPANRHIFYWCQHHISSDGSNIPLIINYLSDIYKALGPEQPQTVTRSVPPSYYEFLTSQKTFADTERNSKITSYWQEKSAVEHDVAEYFGRPFDHTHAKVRRVVDLSDAQRQQIERVLDQPGFRGMNRELSLFVLMATILMVTGYRLHRNPELNLGFPAHVRRNRSMQNMLGIVTGLGFLHLELKPDDSFRALARKIMRELVMSFSHMEPGVQTKESQLSFSSSLNILNAPVESFAGMPVQVKWHYPGFSDANSQLDVNLTDFTGTGRFELSVDMASSVFIDKDQDTYIELLNAVIGALIENPDDHIATVELLTEPQRKAVLELGQGESAPSYMGKTLHDLFRLQVLRTPSALAVKQGGNSLTFSELDAQSDAVAVYLQRNNVQPGDAVGLCIKRSIKMYAAMLGCMKVRAAFVPLDPTYPAERLSYMLENSGAALCLSSAETDVEFKPETAAIVDVEEAVTSGSDGSPVAVDAAACDSDALYIMYTSGSTGLPKGVVGTHAATLNRFHWMWRRYPFQSGEVCCQKTALSFVDSIWELFGPLLQGVPVVVIPDEKVLDIFQFVDELDKERISRLVVVPSFLSVLLDSDVNIGNRLRALENCVVSGEPLPLHVALAFLNKLGHCQLLNLYGSTEVTADVTADHVTHDKLSVKMPIGRPIDGVSVYIVDDHMNLMPRGAVGEICIAGAGLSGGYFGQDELNREKFIDNPFAADHMFKTGDLGKFNAMGLIEHHGRRDAQIKIRGHRIESAEIENTLLGFDHVRSAVVYVGDNDQLFAFYVVTTGESVDEAQLLAYLEARIPDYMIPQLVKIAQVPLLGNGKINRKALSLLLPESQTEKSVVLEPRTPTEKTLVGIWKGTLGLESVDIHADFFDLGGNSIAAMRIMVGAKKAGIRITLKQILDIGTIAGIGIEIDNNPIQHLIKSADRSQQSETIEQSTDEETFASIEQLIASNDRIGGRNNVADMFHLTATQKGILFHLLLQGEEAPLYLAQVRCDLVGDMDLSLFQQAWNVVASRHDMLRSAILHEGLQDPVQVVVKQGEIELEVHDVRMLDKDARKVRCDEIGLQKLDTAIDIDRFPMMRATLVRTEDSVTHLILDWHHILMDGWSLAVLSNEVLLIYAALKKNQDHGLSEPGSFRDHVIALNQQDNNYIQNFWRDKLEDFRVTTPISQQADKSAELFAEANLNVLMDADSTQRLYEFARRCRVTPNSVIQAAWALLLSKYNDTDDVLFGFAVTGRSSGISNYENTVGMFVNSLPMRIKCDGTLSMVDWLQSVQNEQMELVQFENSSLVDIQRASVMPSNAPMFDSLMVFQNVPRLSVSQDFPLEIHNRTVHENSPTPITIEVFPGEQLEVQVMYIEEMFTEYPVEQIINHFINIIKSISANDATALVSDIGLMSDEAVREMTASFNQTQCDYPAHLDVSDLVWQQAQKWPAKLAATFGELTLTYSELTGRADALANYLRHRGLKPDDLVGVCINRDANLLVALLAVMRAGAAYLPLDPDYPQNRIDNILSDADVTLILSSSDVALAEHFSADSTLLLDSQWQQVEQAPPVTRDHEPQPDHLAYVIYTSGSTGMPKGVRITRRNMVNFLCSMQSTPGIREDDHLLAVTTVSFDIAVLELFLPLISGARVDVAARDLTFDGHAMVERIAEQGITMMQATPTTWRLMLAADWTGANEFKALVGGEPFPRDLASQLLPLVGSLWNMYGPTETTVWSTCEHVTDAAAVISIGRPIANTEVLILDSSGNLCPVTIPGELCIAGDGVTQGYVNREDLTREKFVPHPLRPDSGERVYRTGDLGRWMDDGRLECMGRIDSQVKLRGFRIELGEIEAILGEAAGIDHAVVNLFRNGDTEFLAAYLVPDDSYEDVLPNELTLRDLLRASLPLYMIPSTFMMLDELPRMPNGKIDRKSLPNPHASTANLAELANIDVYDLPENQPANDTEQQLGKIWEKILRRDKLSVNSNFFDLGGNSISAMQIMAACRKQGIDLSILDMFNLGTIRLCADAVDNRAEESSRANDKEVGSNVAVTQTHASDDLERIAQMLKSGSRS